MKEVIFFLKIDWPLGDSLLFETSQKINTLDQMNLDEILDNTAEKSDSDCS